MADEIDITLLVDDDGDDSRRPAPPAPAPGRVDTTSRLANGTVVRVASYSDGVHLTIAGPDGMATGLLSADDVNLLIDIIQAAQKDARGW